MNYDALAGELVRLVSRLNRTEAYQRLNEFFKGEMFVLRYLDSGSGSALPGALREAMGVSSARVAAALGALERKGFITRSADATDRRRVIVSITEAGRRQLCARQRVLRVNLEYLLHELGEADAREYIRIVGRIMEISGLSKSERAVKTPYAGRNEEKA
ncbi:MAG TPA: winged helix DNA-binding protein [Oscillospiraceae bacterium]|nr:winged helix DNA-binding protein [Oscillospiraceae bacterium]